MIRPPEYFEAVRRTAEEDWVEFERLPRRAGPWWQLFKQVQSPRHVLSELLQNADDAGATAATVAIEGDEFVFGHNGADFDREQFSSLCGFGFSNKRNLHTIGFRGVGFKSTFSLGDTVRLRTPTLSVAFSRQRFTLPQWVPAAGMEGTEIRVALKDENRQREIEANLAEWQRNPVSLLFLRTLRRLTIAGQPQQWVVLGSGPVPGSQRMQLARSSAGEVLVVRSQAEAFPAEALQEIASERHAGAEDPESADFPPCVVELVLGASGKLYSVLPTGVETSLPFACNAPFLQDPSRLKIKEPATSPTNRWLLDRLGRVAGEATLAWLAEGAVSQRAQAYRLLPEPPTEAVTLPEACAARVFEAFEQAVRGQAVLLTSEGALVEAGEAVAVPQALLKVWPATEVAKLLDAQGRPPISPEVNSEACAKLSRLGWLEMIGAKAVIEWLRASSPPKPKGWAELSELWSYVGEETYRAYGLDKRGLHIVPAKGSLVLWAASQVVRLGEKRLLQSEDDGQFLEPYVRVLDPGWIEYLGSDRGGPGAGRLLSEIGLAGASDPTQVLEQAARDFFAEARPREAALRLAQIAAKIGARAGAAFRFYTRDGELRSIKDGLVWDEGGAVEALMPPEWCPSHLLDDDYSARFLSCSRVEWESWIRSGQAGAAGFVLPGSAVVKFWDRSRFASELRRRCNAEVVEYPFKKSQLRIEDWDFDDGVWRHWERLAARDAGHWVKVARHLLVLPEEQLRRWSTARPVQTSTQWTDRAVTTTLPIPARWVDRLRKLPCLPDTHGQAHVPADLLLRSPATEALLGVEPFVDAGLDTEGAKPFLQLLGAGIKQLGPEGVLKRLKALSESSEPPGEEAEKWYRRLDRLASGSPEALTAIRGALGRERMILTAGGQWTNVAGVYLGRGGEEFGDVEVVRAGVRDLTLWTRIGVAERPSLEMAIAWLKQLPAGTPLAAGELKRVKEAVVRDPGRVWGETGHWLNLAGEWVAAAALTHCLAMKSLTAWKHLFEPVKRGVADFQMLSSELVSEAPFSDVPSLAASIDERPAAPPIPTSPPTDPPWLAQLGREIMRLQLDDSAEEERTHHLGRELQQSVWQACRGLELTPYLGGTPAGTARRAEAAWRDRILYVADGPTARLAKPVAQELGRLLARPDLAEAVVACFDRPAAYVTEYMEANFELAAAEQAMQAAVGASAPTGVPNISTAPEAEIEEAVQETSVADGISGAAPEEDLVPQLPPETTRAREATPLRPVAPSLAERFARGLGFEAGPGGIYRHADGRSLERPHGEKFWEMRSGAGDLLRYLWVSDHCLEQEPLELPTEVWNSLEKFPQTYALLLADARGKPIEVTGAQILGLREQGKLQIYPAAYRLVHAGGEDWR